MSRLDVAVNTGVSSTRVSKKRLFLRLFLTVHAFQLHWIILSVEHVEQTNNSNFEKFATVQTAVLISHLDKSSTCFPMCVLYFINVEQHYVFIVDDWEM